MNKYKFRKYNKRYRSLFNKEKNRLNKIIPFNIKIEHIGSTSVEGLGGKGIIDILLVVNKGDLNKTKRILESQNYELMNNASSKDRISFKKFYGFFFKKRFHIHLTYKNSKTEKEILRFKYNLMNKRGLIEKYELLKKQAVKICRGDGKIYRKHKEDFIKKYSK